MHDYDAAYAKSAAYFGESPEDLLLRFMPDIRPGGRVLDIGVGQGRNALALAANGFRVTGIDTSSAAVDQCRTTAADSGASLDLHRGDVFTFEPDATPYDAIVCLGLIPMLSRPENASLLHRIFDWTARDSLIFLTAWHVDDPSYDEISAAWDRVGLHSYRSPDGEHRTYLARGVIRNLFPGWRTLHFRETFGPAHTHGSGPEHRHGLIELVARRR